MSGTQQKPSGDQPWLGMRLFMVGSVILIATKVDIQSHTTARLILIVMWCMVSFAAMLKEAHTFGVGDRVTLFGMLLIVATSFAATIMDHHPYSFVSLSSLLFALMMLVQVIQDVLRRQEAAEEWTGPGG